jgi:hypothetical protein
VVETKSSVVLAVTALITTTSFQSDQLSFAVITSTLLTDVVLVFVIYGQQLTFLRAK